MHVYVHYMILLQLGCMYTYICLTLGYLSHAENNFKLYSSLFSENNVTPNSLWIFLLWNK